MSIIPWMVLPSYLLYYFPSDECAIPISLINKWLISASSSTAYSTHGLLDILVQLPFIYCCIVLFVYFQLVIQDMNSEL